MEKAGSYAGFFFDGICQNWTSPKDCTPDYYNASCGPLGSPTTTNNSNPESGRAFSGVYVYGHWGNNQNREYIQGTLTKPLEAGKTYGVRFFVKPVLVDRAGLNTGVKEIGIFFNDTIITLSTKNYVIEAVPQVINTGGVVNDTSYWYKIDGCFVAKGGEKYFTIGNFLEDNANTIDYIKGSNKINSQFGNVGYILVDDVSVEELNNEPFFSQKNYSFCSGDSVVLSVKKGNFEKLSWSDGDASQQKTFTSSGNYVLTASWGKSCAIRDSVSINVTNCKMCHFWLPDAFTPDDNTRNEEFKMVSDCQVKLVRMRILNRWGEIVLDITTKQPAWDGNFRGVRAPAGVYVYMCEIVYEYDLQVRRDVVQGTVTLIR